MPKILTIDDSLTVRKLVDLILLDEGYEVVFAEDGVSGLRLAREHQPDLILLDYILPDIASPEVCQELRDDPATADIPIVMISTNGGAIRQLYSDNANVKDYLPKPFQGKVLQTAVQQILGVTPPATAVSSPLADKPPASSPVPPPSDGAGLVLKPRTAARAAPQPSPVAPESGAPRPKVVPPGPAQPSASASPSSRPSRAQGSLRSLLNARFRDVGRMIPELERRRGTMDPATYYLPFLLRNELLAEIATETERGAWAEDRAPLIAGTSEWMSIDTTLSHLARMGVTGVFTMRLPQETVELRLVEGRVVAVHANNPRLYCAGAAYNFRALPTTVIATAVATQQRDGTPFFLTVHRMGKLSDPGTLVALLRGQGVKAVLRALTTPEVRYAFTPRELAPEWRRFSLDQSVRAFIYDVLRGVDDWLEIETAAGSGDTVFDLVPEAESVMPELGLTMAEQGLVARFDGHAPLRQVADDAGMGLYEACAAVYRLVKLQLLQVASAKAPVNHDVAVEDFLQAADPQPPPADDDSSAQPSTRDA